jgi:chromate transporter
MQTHESDITGTPKHTPNRRHFLEVLGIFTRLGLTSFGGPVAHLGYFRDEIVIRRKWVDEHTYGDLVGLCQFLPGPASSQTGISLGIMRAGLLGGLMAWVGFTLPSAILLTLFAYWTSVLRSVVASGILHGLMVIAVAVVAQAVWGMARTHCPDRTRATIAILAAIATLLLPAGIVQVVIIATAGIVGWFLFRNSDTTNVTTSSMLRASIPRALAITSLAIFTALLVLFLLPNLFYQLHALVLFASFYRSGALVFGGGHVVLPLLQAAVVLPGWVTETQFLTGYSAAQAAPVMFP